MAPSNEWQVSSPRIQHRYLYLYSTFLSVSKVGFELEAIFLPHLPKYCDDRWKPPHQLTHSTTVKARWLAPCLTNWPVNWLWFLFLSHLLPNGRDACLSGKEALPSLNTLYPCWRALPGEGREQTASSSFVPGRSSNGQVLSNESTVSSPSFFPLSSYRVHTELADLYRPSWLLERRTLGLGRGHRSEQAHLWVCRKARFHHHILYTPNTRLNHLCL